MSSPVITLVTGEPSGSRRGKAAVAAYWQKAMELVPDLQFELLSVLAGVNSITLYYKGARGRLAAEVFHFGPDRKVTPLLPTMPFNFRLDSAVQGAPCDKPVQRPYLAVSTKLSPELVEYPNSGKFGALAELPGRWQTSTLHVCRARKSIARRRRR
jgi:hypothetical protein